MNGYHKDISGPDKTPKEYIVVNPIERDKKTKEEFQTKYPIETRRPDLFSAIVLYIKKILNFFLRGKSSDALISKHQIISDLVEFKKILAVLENDDQSHNPEYTQKLTEVWHRLVENYYSATKQGSKISDEMAKVQVFIQIIQGYPSHADHTLGFYLTEYAGKDWLPFPFMDLLHELHLEHQENPGDSELQQWISYLDETIASLDIIVEPIS